MCHNHAYVKAISIILFLFFVETQAWAEQPLDKVQTVQIGSQFQGNISIGYLTGEAKEYVYDTSWDGEIGSKLIWELKNVCMVGLGLSFQPLKRIQINLNGWFNVNDGSGEMDDYDWFIRYADWTHWSHSSIVEADGRIFDANMEITLLEPRSWKIKGILGYKYDNWKWKDFGNGPYIYSSSGFRDEVGYFSEGLGITYEQTYKTPYIGIGIEHRLNSLTMEVNLQVSPFVKREAVDHHHLRNIVFYDSYPDGNMVTVGVKGLYYISDTCGIELGYTFQKFYKVKGDSTICYSDGTTIVDYGAAGAELEYNVVSISFIYNF